jgi:hypothetical protein
MSKKDILVFSKKLDTARSRRHFDQTVSGNQDMELVLKLMNVSSTYYTLEQSFNENKMARELRARFNVAVSLRFDVGGHERVLDLNKDDSILLWRARHQTAAETINQFDANGFELLQACRSQDQDYIQLISKIKTRGC